MLAPVGAQEDPAAEPAEGRPERLTRTCHTARALWVPVCMYSACQPRQVLQGYSSTQAEQQARSLVSPEMRIVAEVIWRTSQHATYCMQRLGATA